MADNVSNSPLSLSTFILSEFFMIRRILILFCYHIDRFAPMLKKLRQCGSLNEVNGTRALDALSHFFLAKLPGSGYIN